MSFNKLSLFGVAVIILFGTVDAFLLSQSDTQNVALSEKQSIKSYVITSVPQSVVSYDVHIIPGDFESEYVITNYGSSGVDMTNWLLRNEADYRFYFPNLILEPGRNISAVIEGNAVFLYDANANIICRYPLYS